MKAYIFCEFRFGYLQVVVEAGAYFDLSTVDFIAGRLDVGEDVLLGREYVFRKLLDGFVELDRDQGTLSSDSRVQFCS